LHSRRLARDAQTFTKQLAAIRRECKLRGCGPLIADVDAIAPELADQLPRCLDAGVLATATRRPDLRWDRATIVIDIGPPSAAQREQLWRAALPDGELDARGLVERFPLAPALICRAATAARARVGERVTIDDVAAGVRSVIDDRLAAYARRVTVTQSWDDLVLPADDFDTLIELVARVRQRRRVHDEWGFAAKVGKGLGVSALFSGAPGTGKTMVAGLIARELGLELYQVDLAKVVSKWIGETEKSLAALFDAAEVVPAMLLFDEADALFGKRTEVRSSNDRYANLETNYLLQRLETFTGVCVLTSNHESLIDPAFQRRLSVHVRFEVPDEAQRTELWRAVLPSDAPVACDVDFGSLARRYEMSGGYVRNAAVRAAFLAAEHGSVITSALLERSARIEYEAMGKLATG
jgi:hypothetical protein